LKQAVLIRILFATYGFMRPLILTLSVERLFTESQNSQHLLYQTLLSQKGVYEFRFYPIHFCMGYASGLDCHVYAQNQKDFFASRT